MLSWLSMGKFLPFLRVVFLFRLLGRGFLFVPELVRVVKKYVMDVADSENVDDKTFVAESESLLYLCPDFLSNTFEEFKSFHDFSIEEGQPLGSILISPREKCRKCSNNLVSDGKRNVVVVYHSELGSHLGSRITKFCKKCKIREYYGYWTFGGIRRYDENCLKLPFLLLSEDTAIDLSLIKQCSNLLVVGAVPFSTFASSYNRRFGYNKSVVDPDGELCHVPKRMKREKSKDLKILMKEREKLDRRRLEEGFLLFASLETMLKHGIDIDNVPCDKTELVEAIVGKFHESFVKKWGDHLCNTPGCHDIVVLDGNMKNARQVCACKNVGSLRFSGLNGSVVVGCQDTPAKGSRYCKEHTGFGTTFRDDSVGVQDDKSKEKNEKEDGSLIIGFVNEKCTRTEIFFEVLWSDGRKSWVKESNLPIKIREYIAKGKKYAQEVVEVKEFGQERIELKHSYSDDGEPKKLPVHFSSFGFGVEDSKDNMVVDDNGKEKNLSCGTEKGKHKSKNNRTAGILVVEKPCGVVVDVRELFGSESKTQVYAHLHNLLGKPVMENTSVICYDDACHLKKFSGNPSRCELTEVAKKMATMHMMCDKFHFKNHVDAWCKKNCNPYKCNELKKVNTEVCEQLFSWLSRFSHITKHMNRWRFLFLMLYVLDCHNEDVQNELHG